MMNKTSESYDQQRKRLPAYNFRQHIINCIHQHSTLCLIGETGSGKSSQIPQFILESGMLGNGLMVGITQPRRIACITLANRVTKERGMEKVGEQVGYAIRFENVTCERTKIKFMTDGILLREAITDKLLKRYQVIILDEAHERTVSTDVLFGIVKRVQRERKLCKIPDLKVIIMSATMDVDHFSKYFDSCPVLYLPGRTHPVTINHVKQKQDDYNFAAITTLFQIHLNAPAQEDVLMFLTGKDEIESMCRQIKNIAKSHDLTGKIPLKVFPLHSQMPQNKQMDAFTKLQDNQRKVVVATNIAETSITLPGIKHVIDTGVVKMKKYDSATGMESLKIQKISQAQAWQRSGRAGRESPGTCYRTYTLNEMDEFEKVTKPEILRCNLSSTILQLLAIGINIENFDFMDKPPVEAINSAFKQLKQLGAIKSIQNPVLTETGRKMAHFPIDPIYSKCIVSAIKFECVAEILDLISILSAENVFCEGGPTTRDQAIVQHAKFTSKYGDHLTLLNVFHQFERNQQNNNRKWCSDHFLSSRNLSFAKEVRRQLADICDTLNISVPKSTKPMDRDEVGKCLISGLFNNIAQYQHRDNNYMVLATRQRAQIHPSSVLSGYNSNHNGVNSSNGNGNGIVSNVGKMREHNQKPSHVIFSEIIQTTNTYLRTVTQIDPEWISDVAPDCEYLSRMNSS